MKTIRLFFALAVAIGTPWTFAAGTASTPPLAPQPMAASVDTTDWIIAEDTRAFENGKIHFCSKRDRRPFELGSHCAEEGTLTPQEALAKIGPEGARLTGFSPYFSGYGALRGMILYYKRAEPTR